MCVCPPSAALLRRGDSHISDYHKWVSFIGLSGSLLMSISLICRVLLKCVCVLHLQRHFGEAIPISQIITNGSLFIGLLGSFLI